MKRKVVKQGHNTLTITLPAKWAKKNNLGPSCEVDLVEIKNNLVVGVGFTKKEKEFEFDFSNFERFSLAKLIISLLLNEKY